MKRKLTLWLMVMLMASLACAITAEQPPATEINFQVSPNLTLTAVFAGVDSSMTATSQAATNMAGQPTNQPFNPLTAQPSSTASWVPTVSGDFLEPPSNATTTPRPGGGPLVHPGPKVVAMYVSPAPVIDGDYTEWTGVSYSISQLIYGPDYYLGSQDVSGKFQVGWDAAYLYIGVEVTDNTFVQNSSGELLYLGDSLEILIDADVSGDYYNNSLNNDDYQLGFSPGSAQTAGLPETFVWFPLTKMGSTSKVDVAFVITADGYKMEAAVPWSLIGVTAAVDQHFGFAISISDNDAVGENWQQSMVSNVGTRHLLDPTSWGDIVLAGS